MISVRLPYAFGGRSGYDELRSPSNASWLDFLVERLTPKIALACLIVWILSPPDIVSAGTLSRINALTLDDVAADAVVTPPPVLLVTNADGPEGYALTAGLAARRSAVAASVAALNSTKARALAAMGVEVRLQGAPPLPTLFAGVDAAFILAPLTADREERGQELIAAAASVPNALLLSVVGADLPNVPPSLSAYASLERNFSLRALGARVLRTAFYQQNLLLWAESVRTSRELLLPSVLRSGLAALHQDDVIQVVTNLTAAPSDTTTGRSGVGERCPHALDDSADCRILRLTGPQALGGAAYADALTRSVGSAISFVAATRERVASLLRGTGQLDESEVQLLLDLLALQAGGPPSDDVKLVTGADATPVSDFFDENARAFRPVNPYRRRDDLRQR